MPSTTLLLAASLAISTAALNGPTWTAALKATDGSPVAGRARVEGVSYGASRVTIELSGAPPGGVLPWHLHRGACGAKGGLLGDVSAYPPVKIGPDGHGTAEASLPMQPGASGAVAVQVHKSAMDMTPIACGALTPDMTRVPGAKDTVMHP
jgi:hypothetical protein